MLVGVADVEAQVAVPRVVAAEEMAAVVDAVVAEVEAALPLLALRRLLLPPILR